MPRKPRRRKASATKSRRRLANVLKQSKKQVYKHESHLFEVKTMLEFDIEKHLSKLISAAERKRKPKVLDLGCGSGLTLKDLKILFKENIELTGVSNRREAAWSKTKGINWRVGHAQALKKKFKPNHFDFIFSHIGLQAVTSFKEVLENVHTVLKPGGLFICVLPVSSKWNKKVIDREKFDVIYSRTEGLEFINPVKPGFKLALFHLRKRPFNA